ncbi:hypothetical protein KTO58_11450 [Chitinophaga pendula]|uniref:hypothetical protein n=1 Tax=Chitinophaga TaxID=79328 RepID=UPI000BAFDB3C|nr:MULTISPECIES: hypothetical protein [Chitinophaga]ASZ12612.1 hypothetical protein CK934_17435 [Chitinophaga sp. MD30]UCJ09782.1 hypothetical protein KTO58_11450 [Chitinophaga pendula]
MSEGKEKNSFGILKSLKKLIFEDSPEQEPAAPAPPSASSANATPSNTPLTTVPGPVITPLSQAAGLPVGDVKQMKVKVLEMLEKLNQPGIDFFEVWNAAAEMGSVDGNTLKAAFTSLKYVDKGLSKDKLKTSGQYYLEELQNVINRETAQKQQQKQTIEQNQVKEKANLGEEIVQLEKKLEELSRQLQSKQKELREINSKYEPQIRDIDNKISIGNTAVAEVVADIRHALNLIDNVI